MRNKTLSAFTPEERRRLAAADVTSIEELLDYVGKDWERGADRLAARSSIPVDRLTATVIEQLETLHRRGYGPRSRLLTLLGRHFADATVLLATLVLALLLLRATGVTARMGVPLGTGQVVVTTTRIAEGDLVTHASLALARSNRASDRLSTIDQATGCRATRDIPAGTILTVQMLEH
jgi:hypothetical protein